MKRTQVLLTEEQQDEIRRIARSESISAGAVIRRLIDRALADTQREAMTRAAEKMASYYADGEDPAVREIDPWVAEEPNDVSR
jgi:hypothetical protein